MRYLRNTLYKTQCSRSSNNYYSGHFFLPLDHLKESLTFQNVSMIEDK